MESSTYIYLTNDEDVLLDLNYRYKIKKPTFKQLKKSGKNITEFTNLIKFSNDLEFDHIILIKIVSKILSTNYKFDKDTKNYYLSGHYENIEIMNVICSFIRKYLLCKSCDLPEVCIKSSSKGIKQKCKACGNKNVLLYDDSTFEILYKFI